MKEQYSMAGWKDGKKAQALTKTDKHYSPKDILDAWRHTLTGTYGDVIIYSLFLEADKPYMNAKDINPNTAVFREGKRDLVDQILRIVNNDLTRKE
jgi:hypothetical protein